MKIVIAVGTYYPQTNGVQAVTTYLAEGMAKRGHQVDVITTKVDETPNEEEHKGVHIIRWDVNTVHALHRGDIKGYQEKVKELCVCADGVVIVCPQIVTTDALLPILKEIKCKKILYMHGMHNFKISKFEIETPSLFAHKMWNQVRWAWLYFGHKRWFKQFDRIIQIHRFDGTYDFVLKHYGIESDIIENAADDAFFDAQCAGLNEIRNDYLLNVSNFIPRKNQMTTLEAFYKSNADMTLVLIGSSQTSYYDEIVKAKERFEKQYGKKDVRLLTGVPRTEIAGYVRNASLYVMNSRWEVFPISLVEAMAAGVPFITSDVGIAKYLPGGVIANSIEETRYWIELMSRNKETRKNLGKVGRAYAVENLMIDHKVEQLLGIIGE